MGNDWWELGVPCLMPRGPLFRECHGGIPFAKNFCDPVQEFGELLKFGQREIVTEPGVEAPAGLDFFSRHTRHQADKLDLLAG